MLVQELLTDLSGYGKILRAWQGARDIHKAPDAPPMPGALDFKDVQGFTASVYALIRTDRPITLYRFYETPGLKAPYGKDHPSYLQGLVAGRRPAKKEGLWWSPRRPSLSIDHLRLPDEHSKDDRHYLAVTRKWNRFDLVVEASLFVPSLVYVGRVAPQAEDPTYDSDRAGIVYAGGGIQFRLAEGASRLQVLREHRVR